MTRSLGRLRRGPSLRRRVGVGGFIAIAVLVLALDVFVYVSLREQMNRTLDQVLSTRAQLAVEISRGTSVQALPSRLQRVGIRAEVHLPTGEAYIVQPGATRFEMLPPSLRTDEELVARTVALPDGGNITVYASREGVDATLRRVLTLLTVGTAGLLIAAAVVLWVLSNLALRPLERVVATARRIAQGRTDERLPAEPRDTDIGRMAGAFNEMLDELEAALADARRSEARSRRFLADAAHQLRTPVTAMRTSIAALIREQDPRERERLLDNLLRETARTSRLLEMLLRIARLDRGERPESVSVDLPGIVRDEVERARDLAPNLEVTRTVTGLDHLEVVGDEIGLREALANLLDNARRFAQRRIDVHLDVGDEVTITVRDDGPGMGPDDAARAFDRFFSLDESGGAGLGLPIARAVLRAHRGDATYEDGAFVLRFPRGGAVPTEITPAGPGGEHDADLPTDRQAGPQEQRGAAVSRTPR